MEFLRAFNICGSGLAAQRAKMNAIVSNLANAGTTRTPEGGAYKRQIVVLSAEPLEANFEEYMDDAFRKVKVEEVIKDQECVKKLFDPSHPDANEEGIVTMPDISSVTEMVDMMMVQRAYEACVTAYDTTKNMALKTLEIGK